MLLSPVLACRNARKLRSGLPQDRDILVGILPESEEVNFIGQSLTTEEYSRAKIIQCFSLSINFGSRLYVANNAPRFRLKFSKLQCGGKREPRFSSFRKRITSSNSCSKAVVPSCSCPKSTWTTQFVKDRMTGSK